MLVLLLYRHYWCWCWTVLVLLSNFNSCRKQQQKVNCGIDVVESAAAWVVPLYRYHRYKRQRVSLLQHISSHNNNRQKYIGTNTTVVDTSTCANSNLGIRPDHRHRRRRFLVTITSFGTAIGTTLTSRIISSRSSRTTVANAATLLQFPTEQHQHRQLDVCFVCIIRVLYWIQYQLLQMDQLLLPSSSTNGRSDATTTGSTNTDQQQLLLRNIYVETRIGAKALLTGRLSSGITSRTYTLLSLQLSGCLQDIEWYATSTKSLSRSKRQQIIDLCTSFREGLASIVEFDGLDALIYPSPRIDLLQSQYTYTKLQFIRRIMQEQIIPTGQQLLSSFDDDNVYQRSYKYVQQYYSNEIPTVIPASAATTSSESKPL